MSKIGDDLADAIELNQQEDPIAMASRIAANQAGHDTSILGFREFRDRSTQAIAKLLKNAKLHYAGSAPWPNGQEAILATGSHLSKPASDLIIRCVAEGIAVGYDYERLREASVDRWSRVFDDYEMNAISHASMIARDTKAQAVLMETLADCIRSFDELMQFSEKTGKETWHVWDLWKAALGSASMVMYMCGQRIGEKWHDEEILEGILAVTEEQ